MSPVGDREARQPNKPQASFSPSGDHEARPFMKLQVYVVAKELAVLVQNAQIRDAELRDQATRAAKSAFLNTAEGLPGDSVPMRRKFFSTAEGSAAEVGAALDLAAAFGAVDADVARHGIDLAVRLKRLLRGLR